MNCSVHGTHGKYSRSTRKHGRAGRLFVICGYCGEELQATPNGIFDTNPAKRRVEENKTRHVTLRVTEQDYRTWKRSGVPSNLIFRIGLSNVLQEPLIT